MTKTKVLKLSRCDIKVCEAMCCHDGAYITPEEEQLLHELIENTPELSNILPKEYIVDGYWNNEYYGRKTSVRNHKYKNPGYPSHFPSTRCVFADDMGYCSLEKHARKNNIHPWTYKPSACWKFPLDANMNPPPIESKEDIYRRDDYDGFATIVPCGRHDVHGKPWREILELELNYK